MTQIKNVIGLLSPVLNKAHMYRFNPLTHPHNLSFEELKELELLHYQLSVFLYRIHGGDWEAKLQNREITYQEFSEEMDRVIEQGSPPYTAI